MDILLIPNRDKPDAVAAAARLYDLLTARARGTAHRCAVIPCPTRQDLRTFAPTLVVVLGGDGSILATAQALAGLAVPVVGINFGKLGYLAAFSLDQFLEHLDLLLSGSAPATDRLMLHGAIYPWPATFARGGVFPLADLEALQPRAAGFALNDVVINAGDPFRMIELDVQIDGQRTTTFRSDGVVVATASGSTGYNLSAGGPLISPEVEAMVLTPICPHSLSFRPVVLPATASVLIVPHRLNPGTKVNFDGQLTRPIAENECLLIRRSPTPFTLVENPTINHWQMLAHKLHWAQSPRH
jgi:NAD+ kinase